MAGLVLVVGILGTVALVDAANNQTARNLGEEAATNLARELTEVAHRAPFPSLASDAGAAQAIHALVPGGGALEGDGWEVARRGITFSVGVRACRIAATGAGACDTPPPSGGGGGTGALDGVGVDVLGLLGLSLEGGVPNALCGVFGPGFDLSVLGLADVDASTCANLGSQASVPVDPPALARVVITVSWSDRGRARSIEQVALLADPAARAATL